jgi:hypothetical protein
MDDETSGFKYLTPTQREILMEDIIKPALFAWGRALHVVPVSAGGRLVVDESQLYNGMSCGPGLDSGMPSVQVQIEHVTSGLADTDAVIYVTISFSTTSAILGSHANNVAESTISTAPSPGSTDETRTSVYHLHRGTTGPEYDGGSKPRIDGDWNETSTSFTTLEASSSE